MHGFPIVKTSVVLLSCLVWFVVVVAVAAAVAVTAVAAAVAFAAVVAVAFVWFGLAGDSLDGFDLDILVVHCFSALRTYVRTHVRTCLRFLFSEPYSNGVLQVVYLQILVSRFFVSDLQSSLPSKLCLYKLCR